MKKSITFLFLAVLYMVIYQAKAQNEIKTYQVYDELGHPIPFVNVALYCKDELISGAGGSESGLVFIESKDIQATRIEFSSIGFASKSMSLEENKSIDTISITLNRSHITLDEVVINANVDHERDDTGCEGVTITGTVCRSLRCGLCQIRIDSTIAAVDPPAEEIGAPIVSVYPNPARDVLNIKSEIQITQLYVISMHGSLIFQVDGFNNNQLDVSSLDAGIYLIKAFAGDDFVSMPFVKIR
jgi:hypothetical protein